MVRLLLVLIGHLLLDVLEGLRAIVRRRSHDRVVVALARRFIQACGVGARSVSRLRAQPACEKQVVESSGGELYVYMVWFGRRTRLFREETLGGTRI